MDKVAQIDPRFPGADVARQQVAPSRLESDTARGVVRRRQNASVRQGLAAGFRHLELFLDAHLVGAGPFRSVVHDPLHVGQNNCESRKRI